MNKYIPNPINTNDVNLPDELIELTELIAKNVHERWAARRMAEGWKYGETRDDKLKLHPCLIPYEELPEIEKDYDRTTAFETLKLITKLGFKIDITE